MDFRSAGAVVWIAVVIVLVAGSVLADRLGAPADLMSTLTALIVVAGLALAGMSARTMKPSQYFAAGRDLAAPSVLALGLACLLALAAAGAPRPGLLDLPALSAACAGMLLYGVVASGPLRRIGGHTFTDAVAARFGSRLLTAFAGALAVALPAALALWLGPATVAAVQAASGLGDAAARIAVLVLCAVVILPGGFGGVVAGALLAVTLVALAWSAPLVPALFAEAPARAHWLDQALATFAAGGAPGPDWPVLALAAAGLFTVLNPAAGARHAASAERIGRVAVLAAIAIAFLGVFANEVARQRQTAIETATAQSLPPMVFSDRFRPLMRICGDAPTTPEDVRRICARAGHTGVLPPSANEIDTRGGRWQAAILTIPSAAGEGFALATPLLLLLGLAYACHGAAAGLTHDLLRRFLLPPATAGGALALHRCAGLLALAGALYGPAMLPPLDDRLQPALTFAAACVPLPLVLLARWRRADWRAALCGLASAAIAGAALWSGWLEGPAGALAGAGCAVMAGLAAALIFPAADGAAHAAAVAQGLEPGPLVLERSA